jgi:cytochrome P450
MLTSVPYGDQFRRHRAAMQRFLQPDTVDTYQDMQLKETHRMVVQLLDWEKNKKVEGSWAFSRYVKQ